MKTFLLSLVLLILNTALCAQKHPTANKPGKYSRYTGVEYNTGYGFRLDGFNLFSEKSAFYYASDIKPKSDLKVKPDGFQPGARIGDGLYMDETEITNLAYYEYLFYATLDSSYTYWYGILRDTTVWADLNDQIAQRYDSEYDYKNGLFSHNKNYQSLIDFYHIAPEYFYYPAVGLTYQQAADYCKWRGDLVSVIMSENEKTAGTGIVSRLPTSDEYTKALGFFNWQSYEAELEIDQVGKYYIERILKERIGSRFVIRSYYQEDFAYFESDDDDGAFYALNIDTDQWDPSEIRMPMYVFSLKPNANGLYHLVGNVAEYIVHDGQPHIIGGSFVDQLTESIYKEPKPYSEGANSYTGFRCVNQYIKVEKTLVDD